MTLFEIALIGYYLLFMLIQFYSSMELFDKTAVLPEYSNTVRTVGYGLSYTILFVMALLWPISLPGALLYNIFKKKPNKGSENA